MLKNVLSIGLSILILLSSTVLLASCNDPKSKDFPVKFGDTTISKEPNNIVVLSDNFADIVSYIGYDVKMVGKSIDTDQDFLKIVPSVGTAENPAVDTIVSYETDLVIATDTLGNSAKEKLAEANIPVVQFSYANTSEDLKTLYSNIGMAIGGNVTGKEKGEAAYDELVDTLTSFKSTISNSIIKTFCYLYLDKDGELASFTKDSIEAKLLSYCGAVNIFSDQENEKIDEEKLKISTPTYIFYDEEKTIEYLKENPDLENLSAVRDGRTFIIPKSSFSRQGITYEETIYNMINTMFVKEETVASTEETKPSETVKVEKKKTEKATEVSTEEISNDSDEIVYGDNGNEEEYYDEGNYEEEYADGIDPYGYYDENGEYIY